MKASKHLKVLFILTIVTLCLPWFTYNANVMGYRFGFSFIKWFLMPTVLMAVCVFWPGRSTGIMILGELAHLGYFASMFLVLGLWQQVCNIKAGFHWIEGIRTAQPGYWVAMGYFAVFFVCFQKELLKGKEK